MHATGSSRSVRFRALSWGNRTNLPTKTLRPLSLPPTALFPVPGYSNTCLGTGGSPPSAGAPTCPPRPRHPASIPLPARPPRASSLPVDARNPSVGSGPSRKRRALPSLPQPPRSLSPLLPLVPQSVPDWWRRPEPQVKRGLAPPPAHGPAPRTASHGPAPGNTAPRRMAPPHGPTLPHGPAHNYITRSRPRHTAPPSPASHGPAPGNTARPRPQLHHTAPPSPASHLRYLTTPTAARPHP